MSAAPFSPLAVLDKMACYTPADGPTGVLITVQPATEIDSSVTAVARDHTGQRFLITVRALT